MAGFIAAHGIWSVSDGETLIPLVCQEEQDGQRVVNRVMLDDVGDGARAAQEMVALNEAGARRAVSVVDTYLHLPSGRVDALLVTAVEYEPVRRSVEIAVPYQPADGDQEFAVYRLKLMDLDGVDEADQDELVDAFFDGVESHGEAAPVWQQASVDASV